tara:strand:- start:47 stop:1096 length:1050 start_codon:yes stop_codon:yes gene_type:complete
MISKITNLLSGTLKILKSQIKELISGKRKTDEILDISKDIHRTLVKLDVANVDATRLGNIILRDPELFRQICNSIRNGWSIATGGIFLHSVQSFSGMPIPYGINKIKHRVNLSMFNTYAPWLDDTGFRQYLEKVIPPYYNSAVEEKLSGIPNTGDNTKTLVDVYRCWTLWEALRGVKDIDGDCIEIGVYRGGTSALMLHSLEFFNQSGTVYLCDTFSGVVKAGKRDTAYVGGEHADTEIETVEQFLQNFGPKTKFKIVKGIYPDETKEQIPSKKIKFIHIDVDVYQSAKDCVDTLWPLLQKGGVMIFDDYGVQGLEGVTQLVNELNDSLKNSFLLTMHNGQALFIKKEA